MQILLLALAVGLASAQNNPTPSEIDGNWRTLSEAADNVEKIEEGGDLRGLFRHLECQDECQSMSIRFYVKKDGVCQEFTVVGVKDEGRDDYFTDYSGKNYFSIVYNTEDTIIFYNTNVDEAGTTTKAILAAGKRDSLTEEEQQKFAAVAEEKGIPVENIRNVILTDTCPE